jgi:DnaJ-class molecular chaperone
MSIGKGKDYYAILGVGKTATQENIEKAYKLKVDETGINS